MTVDRCSSFSNVIRFAQGKRRTFRAQKALNEKTATSCGSWKPVTLIANTLEEPCEGCSTRPTILLGPEWDPLLPSPDAERTSKLSIAEGYQTADDEVETLESTTKVWHVFPWRTPLISDRQMREAAVVLTQKGAGIMCRLCRGKTCHVPLSELDDRRAATYSLPELRTPHSCRSVHSTMFSAKSPKY